MHLCIFCPLIQFPFLPPISVSPVGVFQIGGQKMHKCIILPRGGERGWEDQAYAFMHFLPPDLVSFPSTDFSLSYRSFPDRRAKNA